MSWANKSWQEKRMGMIQPGKCVAGALGARGGTLLSFVGQEITEALKQSQVISVIT